MAMAASFTLDYLDEEIDLFMTNFYHNMVCCRSKYDVYIQPRLPQGTGWGEVRRLYEDYLLPSGRKFRKVSFQIRATPQGEAPGPCPNSRPKTRRRRNKRAVVVDNLEEWKRTMDYFPN